MKGESYSLTRDGRAEALKKLVEERDELKGALRIIDAAIRHSGFAPADPSGFLKWLVEQSKRGLAASPPDPERMGLSCVVCSHFAHVCLHQFDEIRMLAVKKMMLTPPVKSEEES